VLDERTARRIRLVGLDVDGVLTDNGVYVGMVHHQPTELKRFDIQDGIAVALLKLAGLKVVIVSGRTSEANVIRANELAVDAFAQDDRARKLPVFAALLERFGVGWDEAAFLGDDLPDVPLLTRVGLPVGVANATADVKVVARYVTTARGGHGAVREFAETLLRARAQWEPTVRAYLAERGDDAWKPTDAIAR
jgi:3-deoxy-D-manno-octulosonate 8-phosphate phosphatase (KDO 8-P phosphatase)